MTTREQNYFYRMAFMGAKLARRTVELKKAVKENLLKGAEIDALAAQLDRQGTLTKERGAFILKVSDTLERHFGVATLARVDGMKLLMTEAPPEIRIKATAKNPYKLVKDAFNWAISLAEEAGRKVEDDVLTGRKLKGLRFYDNVKVPVRPEKRRRIHGEPRQKQAWAVMNEHTRFFREFRPDRKDSYDPGG